MSIIQNDNFKIRAGKPSDDRFGPYITIQDALLVIPRAQRYNGLFFGVYDDYNNLLTTEVTYYYFYGDFSDIEYKRIGKKPVDNVYTTLVNMFSDQENQLDNFFYFNIETDIYYEYLGTVLGTMADYRAFGGSGISNNKVKVVYIHPNSLSGIGTLGSQIVSYINSNRLIESTSEFSKINFALGIDPLWVFPYTFPLILS